MTANSSPDRIQHILALVLAIWFAFLALAYHQSFPAGTLPAHGLTLLVAALILCAAAGLGHAPAAALLGENGSGGIRVLAGLGLGMGILSLVILLLLATGLASALTGWLLIAAGCLLGGRTLAARIQGPWGMLPGASGSVREEIRERWWSLPAMALAGAGWIAALGAALAPAEFYDALIYHLAVPDRYLSSGQVGALSDLFYSQFPAGQGMIYALAMLVTGTRIEAGTLAQVLHLLTGAAAVAATFLAGRRHLSPGVGLLGAVLLATVPGLLLVAIYPIADLAATLYGALVLSTLLELAAREGGERDASRSRRLAVLAGLLSGLALGVKYTTALVVGLPAAAWLVARARRLHRDRIRELLVFAVAAVLAFAPWAVRNALVSGNPAAPYMAGLFGSEESGPALGDELAKRMPEGEGVSGVLLHVLTGPVRVSMERMGAGGYLGIAMVFLIPFVFLARRGAPALAPLAVVSIVAILAWSATVQVTRYLFPALPALVLLAALGASSLTRAAPMIRSPLAVCLGWLIAHNLYLFGVLAITINPYGVVAGVEMPGEYLARRVSYYPAASFINTQLPETSRIMMVGEGRGYYLERDYAAGSPYDRIPLARLAERAVEEGMSLAGVLRSRGFTHLLVSQPEMARIARMHGRRGYFDHLAEEPREAARALLNEASRRTLFQSNGVRVMEVPEG